ncbi:hypothetical protein ACFFSY_21000 [Paenibacillus aurantiacus]|uniref:Uncharacterized protein n=1 Tax=Paenibacillus aurantiacus TaxID=1936118 RepID=A0ABV5KWG5_9BACL
MWKQIVGNMPSGSSFFCALLSGLIPYLIYFINLRLHQYGDPPWVQANAQSKEQGVNAGGQRPNQGADPDANADEVANADADADQQSANPGASDRHDSGNGTGEAADTQPSSSGKHGSSASNTEE